MVTRPGLTHDGYGEGRAGLLGNAQPNGAAKGGSHEFQSGIFGIFQRWGGNRPADSLQSGDPCGRGYGRC